MNLISRIENMRTSLQLEKLVIGIEEPIFIKGVGQILAKVDSGNGAYNVINGYDITYSGDSVIFSTNDDEGNVHRVFKKVQGNITINLGAGHTEDRPIVLFDVTFGNEQYLRVPFTVGNREQAKNKVLLGKDFLTKKLNALIDVTSSEIADKGIQVEIPLTESQLVPSKNENSFLKGNAAAGQNSKAWNATKVGLRGTDEFLRMLGRLNKSNGKGWDYAKNAVTSAWSNTKQYINSLQKSDKTLILNELTKRLMAVGEPVANILVNPQIFKILDYTGTIGNENKVPSAETDIEQPSNPESTQSPVNPTAPPVNEAVDQHMPYMQNAAVIDKYTPKPSTSETPSAQTPTLNKDVLSAIKENYKQLKPVLYLIVYRRDDVANVEQYLAEKFKDYTTLNDVYANNMVLEPGYRSTVNLSSEIVSSLKEKNIFASVSLVTGSNDKRQCKFVTSVTPWKTSNKKSRDSRPPKSPKSLQQQSKKLTANPSSTDDPGSSLSDIVPDPVADTGLNDAPSDIAPVKINPAKQRKKLQKNPTATPRKPKKPKKQSKITPKKEKPEDSTPDLSAINLSEDDFETTDNVDDAAAMGMF